MKQKNCDIILDEIAEIIKTKNDEISLLRWQVADMSEKLKKAERFLPNCENPTKIQLEIRKELQK